ncbi:MAG: hypothetical protein LUD14_12585 [Clostridiales bacterium]|nr:hypothetical protein [Clostridiales bacterium]
MKKSAAICYMAIGMAICLVPFAGMTAFRTDTTTENKTLASFPELMADGSVNLDFFDELSEYFEDHFAFREALVNADAVIQSEVFQVSNVDTIIKGENGWLYYSATLDDYLGQNLMSDRAIYNAAYNLALTQDYVESAGAQFAVTVAPNKNTLYGENMPYYDSYVVSTEKNADRLAEALETQNVAYIDLFSAFEEQEETLYLKRDSHWNAKGAVLAYNEILGGMGIDHDLLETVTAVRTNTEIGDLNAMIYPLTSEPEWNYEYQYESTYTYVTDTESVEDAWIETENAEGEGSLLMFRDSFGNTLLPLMANEFSEAYFSKSVPYKLGEYMETYSPETVVIEKVERNINEFAENPPLIQTLETEFTMETESAENNTTCEVGESENDISYLSINGVLDETTAAEDCEVYLRLTVGETAKTFPAFLVSSDESDFGYQFYLSKDSLAVMTSDGNTTLNVEVITVNGDDAAVVKAVSVETEAYLQ